MDVRHSQKSMYKQDIGEVSPLRAGFIASRTKFFETTFMALDCAVKVEWRGI